MIGTCICLNLNVKIFSIRIKNVINVHAIRAKNRPMVNICNYVFNKIIVKNASKMHKLTTTVKDFEILLHNVILIMQKKRGPYLRTNVRQIPINFSLANKKIYIY